MIEVIEKFIQATIGPSKSLQLHEKHTVCNELMVNKEKGI